MSSRVVQVLITTIALLSLTIPAWASATPEKPPADSGTEYRKNWEKRWVLLSTNMLVDKRAAKANEILERAAKAGYNGIVFSDSKTCTWFSPDRNMPKWEVNAQHLRARAHKLGVDFWVYLMPFGYAEGILAHDVNLATGYPITDAKLKAENGKLISVQSVLITNGSFEEYDGNRFAGWFHDDPGKGSFVDTDVVNDGEASIRFEGMKAANKHGHARINQLLSVEPFQQYRLHVWMKAEDLSGWFAILVKGNGKNRDLQTVSKTLSHYGADWTEYVITFNSINFAQVRIYAGIWGGTSGKLWLDNISIESVPTLNVLRRKSLPLQISSLDGQMYEEERDFRYVSDPKLGRKHPWTGAYDCFHEPPVIELTPESRIRDGEIVTMSCYHALLMPDEQVTCSMIDPKVYDICAAQVRNASKLLQPDGYFLGHDEIRTGGWEPEETRRFKNSGELFAYNIKRCYEIAASEGENRPMCVWSDMYDPHHNAHDNYYMVNNTLTGSWKGLSKDMLIVLWHPQTESARFFEGRGNRQIVAGYYDQDVEQNYKKWMKAIQGVDGIVGTIYCTWSNNWDDLERYAEVWWGGKNR